MRKYLRIVLVLAVIIGVGIYRHVKDPSDWVLGSGNGPDDSHLATVPTSSAVTLLPSATASLTPVTSTAIAPTVTPTATPAPIPIITPIPGPRPVMKLGSVPVFADGTFTGPSARTSYGEMTLRVTMQDQRLESIEVITFPDRTPTSIGLSEKLIPRWIEFAINKQRWQVSGVSGATQTARAFQKALVLALREAAAK